MGVSLRPRRLLVAVAALALLPLSATADWTTYHADLSRTGVDTSGGVGPVVAGWTASGLDAPVYAEPLLVGHTLLVATENNTIYAFDDRLGTQLWSKNLATGLGQAVPSGNLPCGNVSLVGITGTPVVDTAAGVLYAVGLIWDGTNASSIHYELFASDLNNSGALLWHEQVPASGTANFDPKIEGQRAALALTGGIVDIPFGGRYGDCGAYHGWVVGAAASRTGAGPISTFMLPTPNAPNGADQAGGFWGASGSAIDGQGNVYVTSGNTRCSGSCPNFNYGESVIKLSPSLGLLDYFAPSNYATLNANDTDLGGEGPSLLSGGLVFQVGKDGNGFLLRTTNLGGANHMTPAFSGRACRQFADAAFGGNAYDAATGRIYVPCADRLEALNVNTGTPLFSSAWHGPAVSFSGPPIIAGGLVWTIDPAGTLYALDSSNGGIVFSDTFGSAEHFATPTAGDGHVFIAAGTQVRSYKSPWSGWQSLGGGMQNGPDVSSWGSGRLDVFIRGLDNQLWHRWFDGTNWSGWEALGGILTADPSAVSMSPNSIDVFGRGQDNQLWHRSWNGTTWSGWQPLGGGLNSGPDVASWGPGRMDVFIQGMDNQLWQKSFISGAWTGWQPLGGVITAAPGAVGSGGNRIDVVIRGQDNQLWHRWFDGTSWSGWEADGGVLASGPDAASWGAGRLDVFAEGQDHQLWHKWFANGGWNPWHSLGGITTGDIGAVSSGTNLIDVFIRGADGALWHRAYNG